MIHVKHQEVTERDAGSIPAASTILPLYFNHLAHVPQGTIGLQLCAFVSSKAGLRQL